MDGKESNVPSRVSVAASSPDSASNAPIALDNPRSRFGGRELFVEDIIELGNPTLIAHEVAHGIWSAISAIQR